MPQDVVHEEEVVVEEHKEDKEIDEAQLFTPPVIIVCPPSLALEASRPSPLLVASSTSSHLYTQFMLKNLDRNPCSYPVKLR